MFHKISAVIIALALLTPIGAKAQVATSTPTPPSNSICPFLQPCFVATMNPTEAAAFYAQESVTPTPAPVAGLAAGASAGTATASFQAGALSNAASGIILTTLGVGMSAGTIVVATFPTPYNAATDIIVRLWPHNAAAALCSPYVTWTASTATINCAATPAGAMQFAYEVARR